MKFSQDTEELVEAILEKGEITEKERNILRARAEGEDLTPDEMDIIIDHRLAKMKKQASMPPIAPVAGSTKVGNIMKCPNCGAPYEPGTYKCSQCGHVFQNMEAVMSSVKLAEGVQKILNSTDDTVLGALGIGGNKRTRANEYIKNFPVPTAKEDILDFLLALNGKRKATSPFEEAYRAKFIEVKSKAKVLFAGDPQIEAALKNVQGNWWQELSTTTKGLILSIGGMLFMLLIGILLAFIGD